jgi:hypothetical protein
MLRLLLEPADRGRIIFEIAWHAETIGSLQLLRRPAHGAFLDRWRQVARRRIPGPARALLDVVPADGLVPDFLTPASLSALPTDRVMDVLRNGVHPPETARTGLLAVADALTAYHRSCIAPSMTTVTYPVHPPPASATEPRDDPLAR